MTKFKYKKMLKINYLVILLIIIIDNQNYKVMCQNEMHVEENFNDMQNEAVDSRVISVTEESDNNHFQNINDKYNYINSNNDDDNMHKMNDELGLTEISDGMITGERLLKLSESPYLLRQDLEIERGSMLIIEPGVTVHFAPMIGITVRGSIRAIGTPELRITLTTQTNSGYPDVNTSEPQAIGVRLVDGPTPLEGRLQIFNKGIWRSVCSNSRNWTLADYETVCRQMGFQGGRFWNWIEPTHNFHPRLVFEEPNCNGVENTLLECAWNTKQIGSGVCDYHSDIGIQCLPLLEKATSHWRGIRFENAEARQELNHDTTLYDSISTSELRHLNIERAGSGRGRAVTSGIEVLGVPPILRFVTVDHSAYTGINVTKHDASFKFQDVTVRRSRGFGIFLNSSFGQAHLDGCTVSENGADGIRYFGHDLRSDERTDRSTIHDFCTLATTAWQIYPLSLSFEQSRFGASEKECVRGFSTGPGNVLTLNFVYFVIERNETANIDVYDGLSANDRLLGSWLIRNATRPQSLTSTRDKMFIRIRANPRSPIIAHLRITSGQHKAYDLNISRSVIADNGGRGVAIDNLRSQIHVHSSAISNNGHIAGVHITSGAGDVNVTDSQISFNHGDGINITYTGGNRNISRTSISSNKGYGVSVWLNQTNTDRAEYLAFNQTTTLEYSEIIRNLEVGILHGNYCGDFWINITGNWFNDSTSNSVDIQTCWFNNQNDKKLRLQIGHNIFEHNRKIGVIISPALNLEGKIEYNHFQNGYYGALLIRNENIEFMDRFRILPVTMYVQFNQFINNHGIYVASLGLSPYSDRRTQWLLFTRNFVRNNKIQEPFRRSTEEGEGMLGEGRLNPRSRVAAPVVISSNNVDVFRNIISNMDSKYEVGSQLADQSQILNVTYNWLGHSDEEQIYNRLFHRKDRYDLARIEYLPYLLHNSNPGTATIYQFPKFVPRFFTEGSDKVGGEVDGQEILPSGTYYVERDINIRPGGKLLLSTGVTLNFAPSVGMMVTGKLEARGKNIDDIMFTLKRELIMNAENETTDTMPLDAELVMLDAETERVFEIDREPKTVIRLVGGKSEHDGRLQVYVDGRWGTVCDYNWNIINAALVCHQMGLVLNPNDWRLQRSEVPSAGSSEDIVLSNVRCTEHDIDFTECRAEQIGRGEFENSCTHEFDVGVRCYEGGWAGLRIGVLAERADLQYLTIEKAGLFDYMTNTFKPALQMDFARHNLDYVRVVENLQDGLGIIYSDVFSGSSVNNVRNSEFSQNRGNGVSFKQLGLKIQNSNIKDNRGSGISHDSVLSSLEQREISSWFHLTSDFNTGDSDYNPYMLPRDGDDIILHENRMTHILTTRLDSNPVEKSISIRCSPGYVIGIQLLNPIENRSTEDIWIFDSQTGNTKSEVWQVSRDLAVFPVASSSYGIVLQYKSGENALGGVVLILSTIQAPVQNIFNRIVRGPVPTLQISSSRIQRNSRGLTATYYNRYLGEKGETYLRKANESIKIINTEINYNRDEAFFIHAPFWDVHESNISEITLHINNSFITDNGRGIRQFSKDLRSSNNLFHYVLKDTAIERNLFGGLEINLPFVWQYNENFTHSVFLDNCTWSKNQKFGIIIDGHYAVVNISNNLFSDNSCLHGLIGFRGMEKKMRINNNRIIENMGKYIIEFRSDSQSETLGEIPALLTFNEIKRNHRNNNGMQPGSRSFIRGHRNADADPTCVIGFGGVQKVRIHRNLIANNDQDYDLVAGVKSARLNNFLDARQNWWGSTDAEYIDSRIFDFDDWNNHAEALFRPFLLEDNIDSSISISFQENKTVDLDNLGGRIFENLSLWRRATPYIIKSDITIMPNIVLSINPGVVMEFAPNVGILVLGTLQARGTSDAEIIMKPIERKASELNRIERNIEQMAIHDSIRLCTNRNCSLDDSEIDRTHQGFLEYFNHTTLQWIPICDRRFTERNAQVVCREMGFNPLDVFFDHDRRIEFHTNSLTRIWSWVEPLECHGDEIRLEECPERLNGQLYGHRHECKWDSEFVFISCNGEPDHKPYWGGIRFANSEFEQHLYEHRIHDTNTHDTVQRKESQLEYIRIERAGVLHGEKSPAIQSIIKNPTITLVKIKESAHHGVNLISPSDAIHLQFLEIENTLGQGINAISLTGEGRESDESSFTPLRNLDLPYHLFSMIDICDTNKEITIEERVLVYYKYDNNPVNCVKIFNSAFRVKPLGFRLLQSNLFNHSKEYGRRDAIHLFDGDIYNISARAIGTVEADSDNEKRLFKTREPTLSVRMIASGAPARHGFIAEIVTLPISAIGFNRDAQHNISNTQITGSVGGAISYHTAGEVSPILTLERNRFFNNCRQLYGNFSTCESTIRVDVQNMQSFFFRNNLLQSNQGGLSLRADSRGSATSLRGWIHHNLFVKNLNRPSLVIEGRQSSPYQEVIIYKNYFTQNNAAFEDVISLKQVVSNFSMNYIHSNRGGRIIEISGFDKVRLPIYQTTSHNGFYDNIATDWRGRATIVAGTAGQHYIDNIFSNPDNDYEMITVNRSVTVDVWKTKIDAAHNYWSYNRTLAVGGRIRDRSDDPQLLEVQFLPLHMNNETVLDGKCPPGWSLMLDTCYMYIGAPMTFNEARDFCRSDNASLPFIRGDTTNLWLYLQRQMTHLRYTERVWIQDLDLLNQCTTFVYRNVEVDDCDTKSAFLCEIDPKVVINPLSWKADIVAIGVISAFVLFIVFLVLVCVCWYAKSRHRHTQRLERRNSIRQSLRSLNAIDPQGSIRRRNMNTSRSIDTLTKSNVTDYKKMMSNSSIDSMDKSVLSSETSYDIYDPQNQQRNSANNGYNEAVNPKYAEQQKPKVYGLPTYTNNTPSEFELSYRNEGYRDNSVYSGTRNNSVGTALNEDTPIIHQIDPDDMNLDFYGNSSTLPMRAKGENLSFLNELKHRLPEYEPLSHQSPGHSSFLVPASPPEPPSEASHLSMASTLPYEQKINKMGFASPSSNQYSIPEIRKPERIIPKAGSSQKQPQEIRRPDSYMKALKKYARASEVMSPTTADRPRTLYESSGEAQSRSRYSRSKSEALLETNFDEENAMPQTLTSDSRSYSQPLETAM